MPDDHGPPLRISRIAKEVLIPGPDLAINHFGSHRHRRLLVRRIGLAYPFTIHGLLTGVNRESGILEMFSRPFRLPCAGSPPGPQPWRPAPPEAIAAPVVLAPQLRAALPQRGGDLL